MQSAARTRGRGPWLILGVVLAVLLLALLVGPLLFRALWSDLYDVHVQAKVAGAGGHPVAGARVTIIVDPNHYRNRLGISTVRQSEGHQRSSRQQDEDPVEIDLPSRHAAVVPTDERGEIDIVLRIWRGGTSSAFRRPEGRPAFGGVHLVIVEAAGREPVYVEASKSGWTYEWSVDSRYAWSARLDLGRIVLEPVENGAE